MPDYMLYDDPHEVDPSKFTPKTWCDQPGCTGRALPKGDGGDEHAINICLAHLRVAVAFAESFGPLYPTLFGPRAETTEKPDIHLAAGPSVVYYLRFGDKVKIGVTANLQRRLRELPYDEVLAVERGGRDVEARRHRQFAHLRTVREWFEMAPDLERQIDELRPGTSEVTAEHHAVLATGSDSHERASANGLTDDTLLTTDAIGQILDISIAAVHATFDRHGIKPAIGSGGRHPNRWRWGDARRVMTVGAARRTRPRRPATEAQLPIWL